jgi:signal transduction histidine kinase
VKKKIKITETLILYFVIIGFLSITSVSVITYFESRRAILDRSFEQLTSIRNLKRQKTEGFFRDRLRDAELLSRSGEIKSMIGRQKPGALKGLPAESYIAGYIFSSPYYTGLIISHGGSAIFQNQHEVLSMEDGWWQGRQNLIISQLAKAGNRAVLLDYYLWRGDSLHMTICSTIPDSMHGVPGFIALDIPLGVINDIVLESIGDHGFGESGESYLVGSDFLMRSSSRFIPESVLKTKAATEASNMAFTSGEGTIITKDYRGVKVLSSFCRLSVADLDMVLLSEIDLTEVMKPVLRLRNQILLLSITLMIAVFIIGWLLASTIATPVIRVKKAANKVSSGEFPTIDANSNIEEIHELLIAFDEMSLQLKQNREQIQNEQLKQLSAMFDGQEGERRRLSYELHDGLGQMLVALKYRLESLRNVRTDDFSVEFNELDQNVSDAINEVRQMSFNLMPAILNELGLVAAIHSICKKLGQQTNKAIVFESDGSFDVLDEKQKSYIFRIAQELLNNAIRHADASLISLQLIEFPEFYTIIAEDNGKGFPHGPEVLFDGNGLYSIKERVDILKGRFLIQSEINKGTIVRIKIPKHGKHTSI